MGGGGQGSQAQTGPIFRYFGPLTLLVYLVMPHGYLLDIATSFMLKNQLHASAAQVAVFRLVTATPVYLSFIFGLMRDRLNPLQLRDRGFFLIYGPVTAGIFIWMALSTLSYSGLFIGLFAVMLSFRLVTAAYQGLLALVAQEHLMSGRLSVLWNIVQAIPYIAGALAAGYLSENLPPRQTFLLVAGLTLALATMGLWRPRAVFDHAYDRPVARHSSFREDIKRLLKHRAIYPAVLCTLLFQFAPGSNTPLQYYLTNELHASDAAYGYYYGVFLLSFLPVWLFYGYLCKRVSLNKLLWWGTFITIPQMIPLALIHSANGAVLMAIPIGMMGAIAQAAYSDLAMRACPPGLQGTLMMLVDGVYQLSYRGGDLLGVWIYDSSPAHGFLYCVITTSCVYALILPVLLLVPKDLAASADDQPNPDLEGLTARA